MVKTGQVVYCQPMPDRPKDSRPTNHGLYSTSSRRTVMRLTPPLCGPASVVPNGTATGLDIGLSNFSLSLITLSFYTMCKSTTPVFLLAFCFVWGIERCAPLAGGPYANALPFPCYQLMPLCAVHLGALLPGKTGAVIACQKAHHLCQLSAAPGGSAVCRQGAMQMSRSVSQGPVCT